MSEFYYSIEDLPLDEWNGEDGDNSKLANAHLTTFTQADMERETRALSSATLTTSAPAASYVPFIREVKLGTIGKDVLAVKRALSKAGFGKWEDWGTRATWFGPVRVKLLKNFQKKHGLNVDGVYGLATHKKLAPYYDTYGIWLLHQVHPISSADKKRDIIKATAMVGYLNRYSIHYTESSLRMQGVRNRIMPPHYPSYEDCSSFSTWCYWTSRATDPNGLNYNGQGYTGTLTRHGRAINLQFAKPGDLVFYGGSYSVPGHVAVYIGGGRVISHGSESGPLLLNAGYRGLTEVRSYL